MPETRTTTKTLLHNEPLSFMVLEDSEPDVALLRHYLDKIFSRDFSIRHFIHPELARKTIRGEHVDFLFVDYRLIDDQNGVEFLRDLRSNGQNFPALVMSGYGNDDMISQVNAIQNTWYMDKNKLSRDVLHQILSYGIQGVTRKGSEERVTIMMYDDNPADASLVKSYMEAYSDLSIEFLYTDDYSQALNWGVVWEPDVMLVDYMIPQLQQANTNVNNGLSFVRRILETRYDGEILLITGFSNLEDVRREAHRVGVSQFLPKNDLTPETLVLSIRDAIA